MALFVFVAMTLVFRILQATIGLRVSAAEEINGLTSRKTAWYRLTNWTAATIWRICRKP